MARKYKRDGRGRFAGGAGQSNGRSTNSGRRVTPANGSKAMKASKPKLTARTKLRNGAKATARFVKKNPRVIGLAISAGLAAQNIHQIHSDTQSRINARKIVRDLISDKRGLGGRPGSGLKMAKRGRISRAHKIRS